MLDRIRTALISDPWRTASVVLALGLAVAVGFAVTGGGSAGPASSTIPEAGPSTTVTTLLADTTTTSNGAFTATTDPAQPAVPDQTAVVGVKIDNAPAARPQVGIGEADLLIEYPVEGGITRFVAVFPREMVGVAGPIRSLRPVDADLLPALAPVVVSTGGQPFVVREVEAAGMNNIEAGFSSMFVSLGRQDPHDTFVDLALLSTILDDSLKPAGGGLPTSDSLPLMRSVAIEAESPVGPAEFIYEQGTGYVRHEDGQPFEVLGLDAQNPAALTHDTLVFLFAAERSAGYTDSAGAEVLQYDVIGSGELLILHQGEALVGTWSRSAQADGFAFFDDIGEPFGIPDGRTYLAVVPRGGQVTYR